MILVYMHIWGAASHVLLSAVQTHVGEIGLTFVSTETPVPCRVPKA